MQNVLRMSSRMTYIGIWFMNYKRINRHRRIIEILGYDIWID